MTMYIYKMPFGKYLELQRILDINQQWKDLAKQIGTFTSEDIEYIALDAYRPGQSPTNHLLTKWGQSNATVNDLFRHLKAMEHKRALEVLRGVVPDQYFHEDGNIKKADMNGAVESSLDTSGLPSCPESHWQNYKDVVPKMSPDTPLPPYQSEFSWQNDPSRQPTESGCSGSLSEHLVSNGPYSATSSASVHTVALCIMPRFTPEELRIATGNFSPLSEIGRGAFGIVYHGNLDRLRQEVAIKLLNKEDKHELEALFRCRHRNIIQLLGYCQSDGTNCLVYDYMKNGSLSDRLLCLNDRPSLSWMQRVKILCGAAKAIHYLHSLDTPIIHGDIKSANILLDSHFEAKVADFGLAKQVNSGQSKKKTHVSQRNQNIYGSEAYLPDEYLEDLTKLRMVVDTFSFGIVIFETCLGVKANDATMISNGQYKKIKDLMNAYRNTTDDRLLDSKLKDPRCQNWPTFSWMQMIKIGFSCTVESWRKRPPMNKVVDDLECAEIDADRWIQRKDGGLTMPSSYFDQGLSFISEINASTGLEGNNVLVDQFEKMKLECSNNSKELTLTLKGKIKQPIESQCLTDVDLQKVGETSKLDMINAKVIKFEQLSKVNADTGVKLKEEIIKNKLQQTDEAFMLAKFYDTDNKDDRQSSAAEQSNNPKESYQYLCDNSNLHGLTGELSSGSSVADELSLQKAEPNLNKCKLSLLPPSKKDAAQFTSNPLLPFSPGNGACTNGDNSQKLFYLKTESDEETSVRINTPVTTECELQGKIALSYDGSKGGLYNPNAGTSNFSEASISEESSSDASNICTQEKIQCYKMPANNSPGGTLPECDSSEDSLGSYAIQRKKKKQLPPLIQNYRIYINRSAECSNQRSPGGQLAEGVSQVKQAEPVEHVQSLTGSESSDYDGSSLQGHIVEELNQSEAQYKMMLSFSPENAYTVVTSGTPPTASLSSPPVYQLAKH